MSNHNKELDERGIWVIDFTEKKITQQLTEEQIEEIKKEDDEYTGYTEVVNSFEDVYDLISFLLPFGFTHKEFLQLEAVYLQQHMPEQMWMSVDQYRRMYNVSRATIYNRIDAGQLESKKERGFTYVREAND